MKKQKLNLNSLKVQSFVTTEYKMDTNTVKGGAISGKLCDPTLLTICLVCGTVPVFLCPQDS